MRRNRPGPEQEIAIGDRAYRLPTVGLRLAPPPGGDVAVEEGVVEILPVAGGATVKNVGDFNVFAATAALPPGHSARLKTGQTVYLGRTAVRLRLVARPPAPWRRLALPVGLIAVIFTAIVAFGPSTAKPFELETEIGEAYPAALSALSDAREAVARDDRDRARRAYSAIRDVVLATICQRGFRDNDRLTLEALARHMKGW
jgi:hypothetical protein